jgi:hypothetical protein
MKRTTTKPTLSEPQAELMHAIMLALAEYDNRARLRRMRAAKKRKAYANA